MPVIVVDHLEMVQIERQQRQRTIVSPRYLEGLFKELIEVADVLKMRKRISGAQRQQVRIITLELPENGTLLSQRGIQQSPGQSKFIVPYFNP